MKEKIICILFVILLTFLLLFPVSVKAETDGAPYEATLNGFDGNVDGLRWYYSGSNNDGRYDYWIYTGDTNCMILYCNGSFYAVTGNRESTGAYYTIVNYSTNKNTNPNQVAWTHNGIVYSNDYISLQSATTILGEHTEYGYSYDKAFETYEDLISWLDENGSSLVDGDGNIVLPDDEIVNQLPDLNLTIKRKSYMRLGIPVTSFNFYFKWNYFDYDVYKHDPNGYFYELRYDYRDEKAEEYVPKPNSTKLLDNGVVATNETSFSIYEVGKKIKETEGLPQMSAVNFVVYFRTYNEDSSSNWQMWSFNSNYSDYFDFGECDINGKRLTPISNMPDVNVQPDGNKDDLTIGVDGLDDSELNTSASKNKDSDVYSADSVTVDNKNLIAVLKSNVETVKEIASLLEIAYKWLPSWCLAMIGASIGLIVVIGTIKLLFK